MKKIFTIWLLASLGLFSIFGAFPTQSFAETLPFPRYIAYDSVGDDVHLLQQTLNASSTTQLTTSGAGSPGKETYYFGRLTERALIEFQKIHALGTVSGNSTTYSGALDDKTRAYLNDMLLEDSDPSNNGTPKCDRSVSSSSGAFSSFASPQEKANTLNAIMDPSSGNSLEERTEALNNIFKLGVINTPTSTPYIKSIELEGDSIVFDPSRNDGEVTIVGCNFATSTDNIVHLTYNDQKVKSEDGTTLKFELKSDLDDMFKDAIKDMKSKVQKKVAGKMGSPPLFITVENDKGVSNPYHIYFKFTN